jgi:hypothetical protein
LCQSPAPGHEIFPEVRDDFFGNGSATEGFGMFVEGPKADFQFGGAFRAKPERFRLKK